MNVVVFLFLLVSLTGCSAQNSAKKPGGAGQSKQIPWFCQQAATPDDWECVQDKTLAANPKPQRFPQTKTALSDPSPLVLRTSPSKPLEVPPHVALSYQPPRPIALVDLPGEYWAVQLIAMSSKDALEAYAKQNQLAGMSAARVSDGSHLYYVLLLGIYETRDKAQQAVASLTGPLAQHDTWIRSLRSLQTAMAQAEQLAEASQP